MVKFSELEAVPIVDLRFLLFGNPIKNLKFLCMAIEAQEAFIDGTN
jgi:hypothetical protein